MSITLPLSIFLIPFAIVLIYVLVLSLFNLQHLAHYGTSSGTASAAASTWILGTLAILAMTFMMLQGTDWNHPISIDSVGTSIQTDQFGI